MISYGLALLAVTAIPILAVAQSPATPSGAVGPARELAIPDRFVRPAQAAPAGPARQPPAGAARPGPAPAAGQPARAATPPAGSPAATTQPRPPTGSLPGPYAARGAEPAIAAPVLAPPPAPASELTGLTALDSFAGGGIPLMLGDMAPLYGAQRFGAGGGGSPSAIQFPWARGYKMADNQSPRPQDRVFVAFNFFDNLAQAAGSTLHDVKVYREFFGLEKTFFDQKFSLGLRMPLNTITAQGAGGGTSTAVGDLTTFVKGILWENRETGSLLSAGFAVTADNGPSKFAGASFAKSLPATSLQPFFAGIVNFDRWYLQGFTGINVPTDPRVVTMYYNDLGVGYYLFRSHDPNSFIRAIAPTLEAHINTPLNHRTTSAFIGGPPGVPDVVDLTFGVGVALQGNAILSAGVVNPVSGPRPYELEAVVLLNIFFGRGRRPPTPPPTL
jgi:hypothetical protein